MSVFYQNIDLSYTQGDEKCNISPKLVVYKDDYGLDIYFEIKKKDYRFQKDGGENILNSYNGAFVDTYLISPKGEEIVIRNNPVVEDSKLKFTITKDLTDEIEEVGKYTVQFRIGNAATDLDTSIFTLPPFEFEVKKRITDKVNIKVFKYLTNEKGIAYADETGTYIICLEN